MKGIAEPRRPRKSERRRRVNEARRQRWFELGCAALAVARPDLPRGYGCPLCLRLFETREDLRDEHVPPESAGGKELLLTCKPCNDRSGQQLDHHIATGRRIRDVWAGREYASARFIQYGVTLNVEATFGNEPTIRVSDRNNDKALVHQVREWMRRDAETKAVPPEVKLTFRFRYSDWHEQMAWLRVAYLYGFTAFGYSYILQGVFESRSWNRSSSLRHGCFRVW